jgi:hypothetical protein
MRPKIDVPEEQPRPFDGDGVVQALLLLLRRTEASTDSFATIEKEIHPLAFERDALGGRPTSAREELAVARVALLQHQRCLEQATSEGKKSLMADFALRIELREAEVKHLEALTQAFEVLNYPDMKVLQTAVGDSAFRLQETEAQVHRFKSARVPIPPDAVQAVITARKTHVEAMRRYQEAHPVFLGLGDRVAKLRAKGIAALMTAAGKAIIEVGARVKAALATNLRTYEIDAESIPTPIVEDARFGLDIAAHLGLLSGDANETDAFWQALGDAGGPLAVRLRMAKVPARAGGSGASGGASMNDLMSASY